MRLTSTVLCHWYMKPTLLHMQNVVRAKFRILETMKLRMCILWSCSHTIPVSLTLQSQRTNAFRKRRSSSRWSTIGSVIGQLCSMNSLEHHCAHLSTKVILCSRYHIGASLSIKKELKYLSTFLHAFYYQFLCTKHSNLPWIIASMQQKTPKNCSQNTEKPPSATQTKKIHTTSSYIFPKRPSKSHSPCIAA